MRTLPLTSLTWLYLTVGRSLLTLNSQSCGSHSLVPRRDVCYLSNRHGGVKMQVARLLRYPLCSTTHTLIREGLHKQQGGGAQRVGAHSPERPPS